MSPVELEKVDNQIDALLVEVAKRSKEKAESDPKNWSSSQFIKDLQPYLEQKAKDLQLYSEWKRKIEFHKNEILKHLALAKNAQENPNKIALELLRFSNALIPQPLSVATTENIIANHVSYLLAEAYQHLYVLAWNEPLQMVAGTKNRIEEWEYDRFYANLVHILVPDYYTFEAKLIELIDHVRTPAGAVATELQNLRKQLNTLIDNAELAYKKKIYTPVQRDRDIRLKQILETRIAQAENRAKSFVVLPRILEHYLEDVSEAKEALVLLGQINKDDLWKFYHTKQFLMAELPGGKVKDKEVTLAVSHIIDDLNRVGSQNELLPIDRKVAKDYLESLSNYCDKALRHAPYLFESAYQKSIETDIEALTQAKNERLGGIALLTAPGNRIPSIAAIQIFNDNVDYKEQKLARLKSMFHSLKNERKESVFSKMASFRLLLGVNQKGKQKNKPLLQKKNSV
jgi:hypothetical protein